jgi:hypothetical protein
MSTHIRSIAQHSRRAISNVPTGTLTLAALGLSVFVAGVNFPLGVILAAGAIAYGVLSGVHDGKPRDKRERNSLMCQYLDAGLGLAETEDQRALLLAWCETRASQPTRE